MPIALTVLLAPEPGDYRLRRLSAAQLIQQFAMAQQVQDRDAAHGEAGCELRIFIGVDLDDCCTSCQQLCRLSHRRCE
jgi:hypothetical protein